MSMTQQAPDQRPTTSPTAAPLETPFLEVPASLAAPPPAPPTVGESPFLPESPFISEYVADEQTVRPEEPAMRQLLEDLYDSEFDEAVADLAAEAETYVAELGLGESEDGQARAEQMLEAWIEPLRREAQTTLLGLAEAFEAEDPMTMTEGRFDEVFERFATTSTEHGPVFEGFLKKWVKKAKSIARGAVKAAKAGIAAVSKIMPINIVLRKLAGLARPLLTRVLKFALNKLPPEYRDPAKALARRFLGITVPEAESELDDEELDEAEWESEADEADEQPATADVRQIQDSFDVEAVGLLFAPSEQEQDLTLAEAAVSASTAAPSPLAALDSARAEFVDRMSRLGEGEDPTPLVENFLPAILPALRLGLRLAGRPRVVRFLAQYLGRLIAPYVGPAVTPGLSRAIVDAGLRAMTLEAEDEASGASGALAAEAFASIVEDTVTQVAKLDEGDLAHEALVEEAAYTAFHEAAAAGFPAEVLSPQAEFLESSRARGAWVSMPRRGPWRYRKYSRAFDAVIHPPAARMITTFGGRPLSAYLRDSLGRRGPVRVRIHLYQAVPGSSLSRIARAERGVAGLGSATARARAGFHPLTPMAAAALLGEPALGREMPEVFGEASGPLAVGQRLYYLEVPQGTAGPVATASTDAATDATSTGDSAAPAGSGEPTSPTTSATTAAPAGAPVSAPVSTASQVPRSSHARADVDAAAGTVTVTIYISEADAQGIATRLRRREPLGGSLAALRRIYGPALGQVGRAGRVRPRIRVVSELDEDEAGVETEDLIRGRPYRAIRPYRVVRPYRVALRGRRPFVVRRRGLVRYRRRGPLVRRSPLASWTARALAAELDRNRDAFLQAADAPADGVTLVLRLQPPQLRALLAGRIAVAAASGPGTVNVTITPGPVDA